jgi:hypothetical protein
MLPYAKNSITNGFELVLDVESYDYAVSPTREPSYKTFYSRNL